MSDTINPYSLVQKRIAERISKLVVEQDLSYGELSKITGIPKSTLHRYATGETVKVPLVRLEEIACALDVDLPELIGMIPIAKIEHDVTTATTKGEKKMAKGLTDEQVEQEIAKLEGNEYVKLARLEERIRTKRRRRLYMLRYQEKRGRELAEQGLTLEQLRAAEAEEDRELAGGAG